MHHMNINDYTYLVNKPDSIQKKQVDSLNKVLEDFPYFQSARALRLKGLYNQDSFKYNFALKETAAHTADRTVLFDFITSDGFVAIQKGLYDKKIQELHDIDVIDIQIIEPENKLESKTNTLEQSIINSIEVSQLQVEPNLKTIEDNLDIGKPLDFSINEKHSFQEWLQLSRTKPIDREKKGEANFEPSKLDESKKKKNELIDKFIETSPKISPMKQGPIATINSENNKEENSYLMTETLARVYLEQKKYQRAIQAYEILILKYPEKSSFFADRISDIKILQQNNN